VSDILSVAFSPDGKHIAVSGGEIKVWDAATGEEKLFIKGGSRHSVAFSNDGRLVADWENLVKVWDAEGREKLTLKGHTDVVHGVAFSPDGLRIVSGSEDRTVRVWDAASGEAKHTFAASGRVRGVAFSGDGQRVFSGCLDGTVKVWDLGTGQEKISFKVHQDPVNVFAFSGDGKRIATTSGHIGIGNRDESEAGRIRVHDTATGQEVLALRGHWGIVFGVAISHDGRRIIDSGMRVWDTPTSKEKHSLTLDRTAALSDDGQHIIPTGGIPDLPMQVLDAATGREKLAFKAQSKFLVDCLALTGDGRRMVVRSPNGEELKVWDAGARPELCTFKGHKESVFSAAFSGDGQRIVSGSEDGIVKVWDAEGQEKLTLKGHAGPVFRVALSKDGRHIVSASHGRSLKVWDATTGREVHTLKGHSDWVYCVAFSCDSKRIVSGSTDKTVKVWDVTTGEELLTLKGHTDNIWSVAFSPDGLRIASGGRDRTVKVWDAATGQELLTLKGHTSHIESVAFSRDGQRIVSLDENHTVKVWEAPVFPAVRE
jgi:WD40 repeat protein